MLWMSLKNSYSKDSQINCTAPRRYKMTNVFRCLDVKLPTYLPIANLNLAFSFELARGLLLSFNLLLHFLLLDWLTDWLTDSFNWKNNLIKLKKFDWWWSSSSCRKWYRVSVRFQSWGTKGRLSDRIWMERPDGNFTCLFFFSLSLWAATGKLTTLRFKWFFKVSLFEQNVKKQLLTWSLRGT